jgi:hypothetical protein
MTTKEAVLEMIRQMPDNVTVSDIMAALYVRHKIEKGLRQLNAGQGIDHDEVRKMLAPWLE